MWARCNPPLGGLHMAAPEDAAGLFLFKGLIKSGRGAYHRPQLCDIADAAAAVVSVRL